MALEDEGNAITTKEYLDDHVLRISNETGFKTEQKNAIRRALRDMFPMRDCHTLVRPLDDENKLQDLCEHYRETKPAFNEGINQLKTKIESIALSKSFKVCNGSKMDGPMLLALAKELVRQMNDHTMPHMKGAWE